jgi:hypothetical protein
MRATSAFKTSTIALLLCVASSVFVATASAESVCHSSHKHHDDDDSETDYKRPHIHAKPQPYVRPYSSGQGIRDDYEAPRTRYESDFDYEEIQSDHRPDYYDQEDE